MIAYQDIKKMNRDTLQNLLTQAREKFEVEFEPVTINDTTLDVLQIKNLDEYIDELATKSSAQKTPIQLPFWAKIWPASIMLSYNLKHLPAPNGEETLLELGAGVGVCGLYAACLGFSAIITDNDPEALLFARINALQNGLGDKVEVLHLDMAGQSGLNRGTDYILGSEILYVEDLNRPLIKFLTKHLNPGGEVLLGCEYKRHSRKFFKLAAEKFHIREKTIGYKERKTGEGEKQEKFLCKIYSLKRKKDDQD